jgi:hypothetical protein
LLKRERPKKTDGTEPEDQDNPDGLSLFEPKELQPEPKK